MDFLILSNSLMCFKEYFGFWFVFLKQWRISLYFHSLYFNSIFFLLMIFFFWNHFYMKEVWYGIWRKPYVCGPFSLTSRMVLNKKLLLVNCQASSSWCNEESGRGLWVLIGPKSLCPLQSPHSEESDSFIIMLHKSLHFSNTTFPMTETKLFIM